jgi:hypothetical protein
MEETPNAPRKLIDDFQVAEMLGVDVAIVRRWRMANQGPQFLELGRSLGRSVYRYRVEDVMAWIESRRRGGEPLVEVK